MAASVSSSDDCHTAAERERIAAMAFLGRLENCGHAMTHDEARTSIAGELVALIAAAPNEAERAAVLSSYLAAIGAFCWGQIQEKRQRAASSVPLLSLRDHPSATEMRRLLTLATSDCDIGLRQGARCPPPFNRHRAPALVDGPGTASCDGRLFEHPGAYESGVILNRAQTAKMVCDALAAGFGVKGAV